MLWHCRAPFKKPYGWLTWGLLGVVLSPVAIGLTVTALTYSGYEVCLCKHALWTNHQYLTSDSTTYNESVVQQMSCETHAEPSQRIKPPRIQDSSGSIQLPSALCTPLHMP